MGEKEWSPDTVLDVFGDPIARATLVRASDESVAAKDLAEEFGVSPPTVYRRIDPLVDANLLCERQRIDGDGNQRHEYETLVDEISLDVDGDGVTIDIQVRRDLEDFEDGRSELDSGSQRVDTADRTRSMLDDSGRDLT